MSLAFTSVGLMFFRNAVEQRDTRQCSQDIVVTSEAYMSTAGFKSALNSQTTGRGFESLRWLHHYLKYETTLWRLIPGICFFEIATH